MERFSLADVFLSLAPLRRLPWKKIYFIAKRILLPYLTVVKIKLLAALAASIHHLDKVFDDIAFKLVSELGKIFVKNEHSRMAFTRTTGLIGAELSASRILVFKLLFIGICIFLAGAMLPLLLRAALKSSIKVFISFSHECEDAAELIEKRLSKTSIIPIRVPYVEGSSHQVIIDNVLSGIAKCDLLVCVPSNSGSFVDHEVFAASAAKKPIIFIVSEFSGSLPDTADKRYPVFSAERLRSTNYRPLVFLIRYLTYDFQSALLLCLRSAADPIINVSSKLAARTLSCALVMALSISLLHVVSAAESISPNAHAHGDYILEAAVIHFIVLGTFSALTFVACIYVIAFMRRLIVQTLSSRRIRLRTGSGVFNRLDWIQIMADFGNDNHVFDCFLDKPSKAHHEVNDSA